MKRKKGSNARPASTSLALRYSMWVLLALAGVIAAVAVVFRGSLPSSAISLEASQRVIQAAEVAAFAPTIPNTTAVRAPPPEGMAWIPGGEFSMGAMDPPAADQVAMHGAEDARPIHRVYVDGFWMDKTDVTNEEFARFVKATGYVTIAERKPAAEDFPGAPPENLVAGSVVFSPPDHPVPLTNHFQWWSYVEGANWRHPEGPASDLKGREKYPVVQVAYTAMGMRGIGGGMGSITPEQNVVGTLIVDLYDSKTKSLVWRGLAQDTLNQQWQ